MNSLWSHLMSHTKNRQIWLCGALLMTTAVVAHAQQWSGILSPSRAIDWSAAGVVGGIPNRTTICATLNPGASASQINNAISTCPAGQVVFLNAGTYNLTSGITHGKSNVTLRGAGADSTILNISGMTSVSCHIGAGRVFNMCADGGNIGVDSAEHTANWTAGYAKGSTVVTLSNVSGLQVGSTLWLDQLDDNSDGWPATGDVYTCDVGSPNCGNNGTGESYARANRGLVEGHIVTAINGNNVTISPGVWMPTFRSSQSPGAWWANSGTVLQNAGLENLTINMTSCNGCGGLYMINATNSWIKGVRFVKTDTAGSGIWNLFTVNVVNSTITDNYFFGPPTSQVIAMYQVATHVTSNSLFQNNILHRGSNAIIANSTNYGNVFAYNYVDTNVQASIILHGLSSMNLFEGNNGANFSGDTIHGPHSFETIFRNHWDGKAHNPNSTESAAAIILYSNNRFYNVIGNVMDTGHSTSYQTLQAVGTNSIYSLGWQGTGSGSTVANDPNVSRTIMRWGNWDNVNNTSRFVASEVPSGIPNFPNSVPASQTLPASFYLFAKPDWFGSVAWPPVGPDVSSGNISGYGGHANRIPARLCFENAGTDSAFGGSGVKLFNAAACYGSGGGGASPPVGGGSGGTAPPPLNAPGNLRIISG